MDSNVALCPQCRAGEFKFDHARSLALYGGKLRLAILQLKFRRRARLGKKLGGLLSVPWNSLGIPANEAPVIIPVPLHRSRKRERGFNQSELLARGLVRKLTEEHGMARISVETRCLQRLHPTVPQTGLSIPQRRENVRGVFGVVRPDLLAGRTVVIVDDVMTTGATLSSCAAVLKKSGAFRVMALTLARATSQFPDHDADTHSQTIDDFGYKST